MIELVDIDKILASEYNPRKNDEKRLALTELSLRKLGFLLPVYVDASGEILSGHQRSLVARRMGFKKVPVQYVAAMSLQERKNVNILFNRATNDLRKMDTCNTVKERLYNADIDGECEELADIEPNSKESYPCIYATKRIDTMVLAKKNHIKFDSHITALTRLLKGKIGENMLIVINEDMEVINGIGRLQDAVEGKKKVVKCVVVPNSKTNLAYNMLNLLTMDFAMEDTYADILRYNAFMRERNTRETDAEGNCAFGDGFFKGIFPHNIGRDFFKLEGDALDAWKHHYGDKIVDFGAGKLNNTRTLRNAGVFVSAMEPYFVTKGNEIHKKKSLEIVNKFLNEVESGVEYTTVFISSVFNSVPFMADRIKIARIAAALCTPNGRVVCWCQSNMASQFTTTNKRSIPNYAQMRSLVFQIGNKYIQKNTWISDIGCSTGLAIELLIKKYGSQNKYFLCDTSADMLEVVKDKFGVGISENYVKVVNGKIYEVDMPQNHSLVLSILSLQFMPTFRRQQVLRDIYNALNTGGALILVEKILADDSMNDMQVDMYYDMKAANGYSQEAIFAKERSLENVMSPLKVRWNEDMLREAGFSHVEMFWRTLNFCGWVAVK